ncbi:MAG: glutamate-1-semialdehyde 2,1-aminomutase [Capsulimonadaceae bacterium]|nr:glutamate-1-semialdehyde 2,1-aminomutase [Capsulimonadaceae bacterium]
MKDHTKSQDLFAVARTLLPGGVSSPVRSFRSVGGDPLVMERASGSRIFDVDGNSYIDYVMSYGPMLFGHAPAVVTEAIARAAAGGTSFGATSPGEIALARRIVGLVPSVDRVRFVSSGTEAVMSAIRVSRGFTGRTRVIKFDGCYHGHSDGLLAKAGSGLATHDLPDSAGVPSALTAETVTLPFNNVDLFDAALRAHKGAVACVIVEPVPANMGVVLPKPGFLEAVRDLTTKAGAVLIFDEVITGFRLAPGGAQELLGIAPDMTTMGKIIGGGLPLAAFGGRAEIMDLVSPVGPVYQAGTLSGNPVAVAAGTAVLDLIAGTPNLYRDLEAKAARLAEAARESAERRHIPLTVTTIGSLLTLFFTDRPVTDYASARASDTARFARFFRAALEAGISFAPSQFEAAFVSAAHTGDDIEATAAVIDEALGAE